MFLETSFLQSTSGALLLIRPLQWMRENKDQNNSECEHFSRSVKTFSLTLSIFFLFYLYTVVISSWPNNAIEKDFIANLKLERKLPDH